MDDTDIPEPPKEEANRTNDVVEVIGDVVETVADAADVADLGCQIASCFDVVPDCANLDCDPGCL